MELIYKPPEWFAKWFTKWFAGVQPDLVRWVHPKAGLKGVVFRRYGARKITPIMMNNEGMEHGTAPRNRSQVGVGIGRYPEGTI